MIWMMRGGITNGRYNEDCGDDNYCNTGVPGLVLMIIVVIRTVMRCRMRINMMIVMTMISISYVSLVYVQ